MEGARAQGEMGENHQQDERAGQVCVTFRGDEKDFLHVSREVLQLASPTFKAQLNEVWSAGSNIINIDRDRAEFEEM